MQNKKNQLLISAIIVLLSATVLGQMLPAYSVSDDSDEWPMYRHDLNHSGFSFSSAPSNDSVRWVYNTTSEVNSSPAVANGRVIVGCSNGEVVAFSKVTGKRLWTYDTNGGQNSIWSSPAIDSGKVFIGSRNNKLFCLNEIDGSFVWSYTTGNDVDSSPAVKDGKVFFISNDGNIYCLNIDDGSVAWTYTCSESDKDSFSSPAVVDDMLYVGSGTATCKQSA